MGLLNRDEQNTTPEEQSAENEGLATPDTGTSEGADATDPSETAGPSEPNVTESSGADTTGDGELDGEATESLDASGAPSAVTLPALPPDRGNPLDRAPSDLTPGAPVEETAEEAEEARAAASDGNNEGLEQS